MDRQNNATNTIANDAGAEMKALAPTRKCPTKNRIVDFVMKDGQPRPLLIVEVWSDDSVNGVLFFDGANDENNFPADHVPENTGGVKQLCTTWLEKIPYGEQLAMAGTWRWPSVFGLAEAKLAEVGSEVRQEAAIPGHVLSLISRRVANETESIYNGVKQLLAEHLDTVKSLLDGHDAAVQSAVAAVNESVVNMTAAVKMVGNSPATEPDTRTPDPTATKANDVPPDPNGLDLISPTVAPE